MPRPAAGKDVDGCTVVISDDAQTHELTPGTGGVGEHEHVPTYPLNGPPPGIWSLHS